jgi:hypothetical protein
MAAYTTREDAEKYAEVTLGGVTYSNGAHLDRIAESVYGIRRLEDESTEAYRARCRDALTGPVCQAPLFGGWMEAVADVARIAAEAITRAFDSSPRAQAKARADRFESQLPGLLDAAPRGARDGFGRRQGPGWDAWLRALADVREWVVANDGLGGHTATVLAASYRRWTALTGIEVEPYRGTPGAGEVAP